MKVSTYAGSAVVMPTLHVAEDRRIVDEVIDAPNASVGGGHRLAAAEIADVGMDEQGALAEISRNCSPCFFVEFGDDDAGPGVQRPGIRFTDAAPGSGDDGDTVGESLGHQASSMVMVR